MNIILFGMPGIGKGTQANLLKKKLKLISISPGEIIRDEVKKKIEFKKIIEKKQKNGELIDNKTIFNVIKKKIKLDQNLLFDGFPRNITQAIFLKKEKIKITYIINLKIKKKNLIKRLKYRIMEQKTQKTYNIIGKRPKIKNKDNINGNKLLFRNDDKYITILKRIKIYENNIKNLLNFYKNKSILINIDSNNSIKNIFKNIIKNIK